MNKLVITTSALKDLQALADREREVVVSTLERLQIDPTRDLVGVEPGGESDRQPIRVAAAGDSRIYFKYLPDRSMLQILLIKKKA